MEPREVIILLLAIIFGGVIGYSIVNMQQSTTHYLGDTVSTATPTSSGSSSGGIIVYQPKITAIVAYKDTCLYCDIVRDDIKTKVDIVRELNVDLSNQYNELISYLNKLHIDYLGVPTVLIGHYAFFSYQQTYDCPTYATEVEVTVGTQKVRLCRINDQPNYYIYIPDRVAELVAACKATKDPSCFLA